MRKSRSYSFQLADRGRTEARLSSSESFQDVIAPPHRGHRQSGGGVGEGVSEGGADGLFAQAMSAKHSGRRAARRRWAKNPKWRMRTNPGGRICRKKRRRNSSSGSFIRRFLFLWAESRHRKVTSPWSSATRR